MTPQQDERLLKMLSGIGEALTFIFFALVFSGCVQLCAMVKR